MREIKCRGYYEYGDKWVYGSYVDNYIVNGVVEADEDYIAIEEWYPVNPLSIGQYTGLKDKNGVEIYEGDIIRTTFPHCTAVVVWEEDTVRYIGYTIESERKIVYVDRVDRNDKSAVEIIGNVYQNPELLEVKYMSEKDRCYTVVEELELELRLVRRVVDIYEDEISKLKQKNYFLEEEIKELKLERYKLRTAIERGIS